MHRTMIILILLLVFLPVLLYSQEDDGQDGDPSVEEDWDIYETGLYTAGDQLLSISLGVVFPAVFVSNGKVIDHNFTPPVGGVGSLAFNYFLGAHVFVGGEANFLFIPTLGQNTSYYVPFGLRAGYQFNIWRLEFPLTITLGMALHKYLNLGYFGFFMKGGAAAYFRFNSQWSFGLNAAWGWYPEWTSNSSENVDGNMVDLTLSARYHF